MSESYYSILGVPTSATQRDIKVAYRKLVQSHHPDVNNSTDDELIKIINVAYETLSNAEKKEKYDRSLISGYEYTAPTQSYQETTYRSPRKPPPNFYKFKGAPTSNNYTYSTKTKIIGWGATILVILSVVLGIRALHYFTSTYYFKEGLSAEANNDLEAALGFYQLAIRDWGSKSVEASIKSAELSKKLGAFHYMVDFCERGFVYEPDSLQAAKLFFLEGEAYARTERFQKAELAFLNSSRYGFDKDTIYQHLGWIYINHLGKYRKAEEVYSYLLASNSINMSDYYNRGICYQYLGEHQKAIDDFLIVLEDNPYQGKTLFQLGRSYLALGKKEEACYYLRFSENQSVNIDPKELAKACD